MDSTDRLKQHHEDVFKCQELQVRERHPEWTYEQVQQRCDELREYILYREENRELPEYIAKYWKKKTRN